jgi:hypothetical protein
LSQKYRRHQATCATTDDDVWMDFHYLERLYFNLSCSLMRFL